MRVPALSSVVLAAAATMSCTAAVSAAPPPPPGAEQARTQLAALKVEPEGTNTGYDRDKFPHWSDQGSNCNTREVVLKRDGQNVTVGSNCYPTSGSWTSPYDGATWTKASDIDIDHMVALAEAWRSGASAWTTQRRRAFANDLSSSQLWAVTDTVNQGKGDKDPAEWKPPLTSFHCTYARSWIEVKHLYGLTMDSAEKTALGEMLDRC
ncbi:hypothetical protein GCM10010182_00470 [Actinomadura cremea]|nr:hypothetical protein GCM10010182_00470 [Actinomadura cremea]